MPIYMDRHDLSGATAEDVAQVHQNDLLIQDQFGCTGLTYWFDEQRGTAFCLVEAPDENAVKNMHDHAHGLVPNQIIEVESNVVEAFLGRIHDPEPEDNINESGLLILNDPAFRVIMAIEFDESELISLHNTPDISSGINQRFNEAVQKTTAQFQGRQVEHVNDGFLISYDSVSNALSCALELQSELQTVYADSEMTFAAQIGLSAGVPITENENFFGDTIQQAKRLCKTSKEGQIFISSNLTEYLSADDLKQLSNRNLVNLLTADDEEFLMNLYRVTDIYWTNPDFTIELFNAKMGVSRSQMYRKTVSITGVSPNDFIKEYRLKMSLKLLVSSQSNISEIAYESGFSSPSYFSKCFQKKYGFSPSILQGLKAV